MLLHSLLSKKKLNNFFSNSLIIYQVYLNASDNILRKFQKILSKLRCTICYQRAFLKYVFMENFNCISLKRIMSHIEKNN